MLLWAAVPSSQKVNLLPALLRRSQSCQPGPVYLGRFSGIVYFSQLVVRNFFSEGWGGIIGKEKES